MNLTSLSFLIFCIASVLLYVLFPPKYRWISLLISSIAFYWISARWFILYAVFASLNIWFFSRILQTYSIRIKKLRKITDKEVKKKKTNQLKRKRKVILAVALAINIGILLVFKVLNYLFASVSSLLPLLLGAEGGTIFALTIPLGLSYYTFSTVGYLLDIYWGRYKSEKNPLRFFLYTIYFPHLLQGPISRYNLLGSELKKNELHFRWDNFVVGFESVILGCFKKLVIADRVAVFVRNTLYSGKELNGSIFLLAMIFDAIQIYTDFSGYMDIVSGMSIMFDVKLEKNFNHPFFADSVPEFWRRWHMSLGSWFKDYVYYPITLSRLSKKINRKVRKWKSAKAKALASTALPVIITWLLTGLWHGTGIGYVLWGFYYGTLILLSISFSGDIKTAIDKLHITTACFSYKLFRTIKIFFIFMGGRFLATTITFGEKALIIRQIFTSFWDFAIYDYGLDSVNFLIVIVSLLILVAIAVIEKKEDIFAWFNKQNIVFRYLILCVFLLIVMLLGIYGSTYDSSNFMYQQF